MEQPASAEDVAVFSAQLGREPRGVVGVGWRCPCGKPGVTLTAPRLPGGSPFPTTFYLTCPNAVAACSRLEAGGAMVKMNERLRSDESLAAAYADAHESYISARVALGGDVPEIANVSAGGMPSRVKCLHALLGHSLAAGRGANPLGDEVRDTIGEFWTAPCLGSDTVKNTGTSAGADTGTCGLGPGTSIDTGTGTTEDPCE
jgi:hypothetical protein